MTLLVYTGQLIFVAPMTNAWLFLIELLTGYFLIGTRIQSLTIIIIIFFSS